MVAGILSRFGPDRNAALGAEFGTWCVVYREAFPGPVWQFWRDYNFGENVAAVPSGAFQARFIAEGSTPHAGLLPASFLGRRPAFLSGRGDAEILKVLARLQRSRKPSWFQPTSCPGLVGIFGIAVFRSYSASGTAPTSPRPQSSRCKTLQFAELGLNRSAFLNDFGAESRINLLSEL
jgi:hypothetical protein